MFKLFKKTATQILQADPSGLGVGLYKNVLSYGL